MPERKDIIGIAGSLKPYASQQEDGKTKIWTGEQNGANFSLIRESGIGICPTVLALTVSGNETARGKIIQDFEEALGKPLYERSDGKNPGKIFVSWDAETTNQPKGTTSETSS